MDLHISLSSEYVQITWKPAIFSWNIHGFMATMDSLVTHHQKFGQLYDAVFTMDWASDQEFSRSLVNYMTLILPGHFLGHISSYSTRASAGVRVSFRSCVCLDTLCLLKSNPINFIKVAEMSISKCPNIANWGKPGFFKSLNCLEITRSRERSYDGRRSSWCIQSQKIRIFWNLS